MGRESLVGPCVAIEPVPARADLPIETTVVRHGDAVATNEPNARIIELGATKLIGRTKLEISSNDVDCGAQCALSFSRWRAAFARLPQVDMSHQRRRPFFVLS